MTMTTNTFLPFHFQTMDSAIDLLLPCEEHQQLRIHEIGCEWFGRDEKRFSHQLADSEINLLNTLAGESCLVSNTMLEVLFLAEMYQAVTDGNYTPLLYNDSTVPAHKQTPSLQGWKVNPATKSVTLPQQTCIHLQGLDKSWSLKRFADYLQRNLSLKQGLILTEGDVTVWGQRSNSKQEPWMIGIQNPWHQNTKLGAIVMLEGALSTYSPLEDRTHSGNSDVQQCSVAGLNLVECHVWARLLGSLGMEAGLALLAKRSDSCEAVILSTTGELHYYGQEASLGHRWLNLEVDHFHFSDSARVADGDSFA